jgi:hypothetical protein
MTTNTRFLAFFTISLVGCSGGGFSSQRGNEPDSGPPISTGGESGDSGTGSGSVTGSGGRLTLHASGGISGSSGGTGGTADGDSGLHGTGGMLNSGGTPSSGGTTNSGGISSTGGSSGTGGIQSTGGTNSGGTSSTGGSQGSGGSTATGGSIGADACVPQLCANDGVTCGMVDDGCGGKSKCLHQCNVSLDQVCGADSQQPNHCSLLCPTEADKIALCAGKCGSVSGGACDTIFCGDHGGIACNTTYAYCDAQPITTGPKTVAIGDCKGLQKETLQTSQCPLGSDHPFPYVGPSSSTFNNQIQDDGESDVDCGGPHNPTRCAVGKVCIGNSDCATQACVSGTGPFPTCANSSFRVKGCIETGAVWCCTDSSVGCYRGDATMDTQCGAPGTGSWGFTCKQAPSSSACNPLPGIPQTRFCCHNWF